MKSFVLIAAIVSSVSAFATPAPTRVSSNKAVLHFCPKVGGQSAPGCTPSIEIDKTNYLLRLTTPALQKQFAGIEGAYGFHRIYQSLPGTAVGIISREKGLFPNPTVEFDIFTAESLNFILPR